jgi:hypothetical protein
VYCLKINAQIEKVIVETYYISDSLDATDVTGIPLPKGSTTYRIFIDLKAGSKLKKIYGSEFHPIKIMSTDTFWNNTDNGQSFAYLINKNRLGDNTVALDSWITLGQATKLTPIPYFGVPKVNDRDGSIVGGANNDGGSEAIPEGLLTNNNAQIGIALTEKDGLDTMTISPENWSSYGILDESTNEDSTIFGSLKRGVNFISYNAGIQNSGVTGVLPDSNQVLVAQLTTKGTLTFELNAEIEIFDGIITKTVKYVSNSDTLFAGEEFSPFLKYPLICGCKDPNYAEYNVEFGCSEPSACVTPILLGCMDTAACNFDRKANLHVPSLCCYPGYCNDRDLSAVCPELTIGTFQFFLYPNPANEFIKLKFTTTTDKQASYIIYNSDGTAITSEVSLGVVNGTIVEDIKIQDLNNGIYLMKINIDGSYFQKSFSKYQ